jgi:hypothetical protein
MSLPMRFDPKISAIQERLALVALSVDELHGIVTTYEMRTKQDNPTMKEETFKAYIKRKKNKLKPKSNTNCNDD